MLGLGNECRVEDSMMRALLKEWRRDPRHLYAGPANANGNIIPEYDYYVAADYQDERVRYRVAGWPATPEHTWFATLAPQTSVDYRKAVAKYPKPLVAHEVVSRPSYPDLESLGKYTGLLMPGYIDIARDQVAERALAEQVPDFIRASGRWQVQLFKEEIEAALRTPGFGGFQLLSLQDFPGQGGAMVGVTDAFWDPKSYVGPEEFRRFCGVTVPLARLEKRAWRADERFSAAVEVAHFGAEPLRGVEARWRILDAAGKPVAANSFERTDVPVGNGTRLGMVVREAGQLAAPAKYRLEVELPQTGSVNDWEFWVFPPPAPRAVPDGIVIAKQPDERTLEQLRAGATVLLLAPRESVRGDIPQCFTSVRWSCPWTNGGESQTMGLLAKPSHPVFGRFPTDEHSNWHWYELLITARPMILDGWGVEHPWPKSYRPLVQMIDDFNQNRKLAVLAEARFGKGKLVVCSMDLESDLEKRIVAAQFRESLLAYMRSPAFQPAVTIGVEELRGLFRE